MLDISGFGAKVMILSLQSFPMGFSIDNFADDVDPIIFDEVNTTDFEMLYDGSLYSFDKAAPLHVHISVLPGSSDDINLKIMLQTRKSGVSILPIEDAASMSIQYADGGMVMLTNGAMLKGQLADSVVNGGRKKSNTYTFAFGSYAGALSGLQAAVSVGQNLAGLL